MHIKIQQADESKNKRNTKKEEQEWENILWICNQLKKTNENINSDDFQPAKKPSLSLWVILTSVLENVSFPFKGAWEREAKLIKPNFLSLSK